MHSAEELNVPEEEFVHGPIFLAKYTWYLARIIFSLLNTYICNHAGYLNTQKFSFICSVEENWVACLIFKTYSRKKIQSTFHKKTISEIPFYFKFNADTMFV